MTITDEIPSQPYIDLAIERARICNRFVSNSGLNYLDINREVDMEIEYEDFSLNDFPEENRNDHVMKTGSEKKRVDR